MLQNKNCNFNIGNIVFEAYEAFFKFELLFCYVHIVYIILVA